MKHCTKCNTLKSFDEFAKNKKKKDGYQTSCKSCTAEYKKTYYSENRESIIKKAATHKRGMRDWLFEYKSKLSCEECGIKVHPIALDFHHIDGKDKEDNIAVMMRSSLGKDKILKEIEKCVPVCANCHRILHYNERNNAGIA